MTPLCCQGKPYRHAENCKKMGQVIDGAHWQRVVHLIKTKSLLAKRRSGYIELCMQKINNERIIQEEIQHQRER